MRGAVGRATLAVHHGWQRARNKAFSLCVAGAFREFGRRSVIALPVRLRSPEHVAIGSGVFLGAGCWIQTLPGEHCDAPRLAIGDGTSVSGSCVLSAALEVVLERNVLLARNVYVSDHIHAYADHSRPVMRQGLAKVAPVRIEEGAWLGQNVVVAPGVTIGRGAVVGANSVVNADVPAWSVAVGAPARVVKRFGPETR
jgi:acetyltransferase-like isoleucine patch superfamily enzyme